MWGTVIRREKGDSVMWGVFAAFAVGYALMSVLSGDSLIARVVLGAAYLAVAAMAVAAVMRVVRTTVGIERRAWLFLLATVGLLFTGDLVWVFREVLVGSVGAYSPGLAEAFYLASYVPLLLYTFVVLAAGLSGAPVLTKVRYVLDLAIAVLLVGSLLVLLVLLPSYRALEPGELVSWAIHACFLMASTVVLVSLFAAILEARERLWTRWETKIVIAVAFAVVASGTTIIFKLYSAGRAVPYADIAVDILWMSAYVTLSTAATQRVHGRMGATALPVTAHARRTALRWYDIGVAAVLMFTVPYTLFQARYGHVGEAEFWLLACASFGVALLVITRSIILTSENGSLLSHTVVDPLTGAFNHRYFQERVAIEIDRARRAGESVSLVLMDIDGFSKVNEHHGHSGGDRCLRRLADLLRLDEHPDDTVCRMGGDEFAIIMANTDFHGAASRARAIQAAIGSDPQARECIESVSIGIASSPEHATERTALVAKADGALYWAQAIGSGNVVVYDEQVVEALGPEERLHIAEEQSYMQTVESLASAVDARDPYTQFHSRNVSRLAGQLARRVGLAPNHVRLVEIAGLLHDVGKIGVPDSILRKPGNLSPGERRKIEEHPDLGQRILSATIFKEILPWVLSHHECWDGSGYPQRIAGEEIPFEARILAVCDSFDAMVSDRPYRKGVAFDVALREIESHSGIQFDPELVELFAELVLSAEYVNSPSVLVAAENSAVMTPEFG
ncbi:MAG: hypothetical protein CVT67_03840 [Actinobacteria bacterium HGW-Actinobacteria-7]|jgi:diguanylate cyclase (GGDEF)-like protein|nr:MAG: hypothetical protein CVT67_03840 [Actinobacteria bacterium HGW-Actinobacteria-7]